MDRTDSVGLRGSIEVCYDRSTIDRPSTQCLRSSYLSRALALFVQNWQNRNPMVPFVLYCLFVHFTWVFIALWVILFCPFFLRFHSSELPNRVPIHDDLRLGHHLAIALRGSSHRVAC